MIEAEMYGITLRAKIAIRSTAPPEKVFHMPRMPSDALPNWAA